MKHLYRSRIFSYSPLCLLIVAAFPAHAQQTSQTASVTLGEVLISASAEHPLPTNSVRLSGNLAAQGAASSDTASLLRDVPGVSLYGAGGVSSLPVIHGMADDRVRVKLDGMDLIASCPNHMNPALSYLAPSNVGALKVYAGIAPVSVGGDSIGGTIVAETLAPVFATAEQGNLFKGEAGAFYRSNGKAAGANLQATYATEVFSMTYSGAQAEANNYQAGSSFKVSNVSGRPGHTLPLDEVGSTAYETRNHTLGFALRSDKHLFEAKLGYQDMPYQLYPNQRMDLLGNTQNSLNLRYLGQFDWGTLEARAYHESVEHFMDFGADKRYWYGTASGAGVTGAACSPLSGTAPTCAAGMPMHTEGKTSGVTLKADIALSSDDFLRVGGEYQRYRLNDWWPASGGGMWPGVFWNINAGERDRSALFSEWEKKFSPQWLTLLGVRYERIEADTGNVRGYDPTTNGMAPMFNYQKRDGDAFNASSRNKTDNNWDLAALTRYTPSHTQEIEFGFARKVRSPNLYERYSWSTWSMAAVMNNFVGDGNGYLGDINLKPEKAHTLSATFDWHAADRGSELKVTPYYTQVTDYIDAVQWNPATNTQRTALLQKQFSVLRFTNQSARLYGLDLSGRMPIAKTSLGEFGFKGLLNYTHGKNRDTGDDLYNIMPLNSKLTLTQKLGGWDNGLELVVVKAKRSVSDARNEIQTPGYGLLNLRTSYAWQKVRVDFGIENLFDKAYAMPLGGAYMGQGRSMAINPTDGTMAWGTAVPGMGRSFYTGVNLKF